MKAADRSLLRLERALGIFKMVVDLPPEYVSQGNLESEKYPITCKNSIQLTITCFSILNHLFGPNSYTVCHEGCVSSSVGHGGSYLM